MTEPGHTAAERLLERHREIDAPQTFRLLGEEWDLLPGVYAPHLTQAAALYAEWIPYPPGGSLCEVGSGTGYLAVTAARRGCARVVALDVVPAAVENTRRNVARHGVDDVVQVVESDMFGALDADDRYDVILWNSSFVDARGGDGGDLGRAFFDPGYDAHERYLREGSARLARGGRLLLGFADLGDRRRLIEIANGLGLRLVVLRAAPCDSPAGPIEYQLLELAPAS